jgi:hypothetical protein
MSNGEGQGFSFPRRHRRPSRCERDPLGVRGRREDRALAAPMARLQNKKQAAVTTGLAEHPAFPARWAYGLYVLSPGTGVLAPVTCELVAIRRLSASTGAPGPHDFAVRKRIVRRRVVSSLRHAHVHRIPKPNARDDREAPLSSGRDARKCGADLPDKASASWLRQSNPTGSLRTTPVRSPSLSSGHSGARQRVRATRGPMTGSARARNP